MRCGPRALVEGVLASEYQEQAIGRGVSRQGPVVAIFVNPETRTWTAVLERPDGLACILDAGEDWELAEPVIQGEPS
jgi:hypothetical protein